jgi:hypothetical protein
MYNFFRKQTANYINYFQSWPIFISKVGRFSLPKLADFYFQSWPIFISKVGRFPSGLDTWLRIIYFMLWQEA